MDLHVTVGCLVPQLLCEPFVSVRGRTQNSELHLATRLLEQGRCLEPEICSRPRREMAHVEDPQGRLQRLARECRFVRGDDSIADDLGASSKSGQHATDGFERESTGDERPLRGEMRQIHESAHPAAAGSLCLVDMADRTDATATGDQRPLRDRHGGDVDDVRADSSHQAPDARQPEERSTGQRRPAARTEQLLAQDQHPDHLDLCADAFQLHGQGPGRGQRDDHPASCFSQAGHALQQHAVRTEQSGAGVGCEDCPCGASHHGHPGSRHDRQRSSVGRVRVAGRCAAWRRAVSRARCVRGLFRLFAARWAAMYAHSEVRCPFCRIIH